MTEYMDGKYEWEEEITIDPIPEAKSCYQRKYVVRLEDDIRTAIDKVDSMISCIESLSQSGKSIVVIMKTGALVFRGSLGRIWIPHEGRYSFSIPCSLGAEEEYSGEEVIEYLNKVRSAMKEELSKQKKIVEGNEKFIKEG